jgi:hypothetical protein
MEIRMIQTTASAPFARTAMAYVLAGGRGSRLMELTDVRAKPAVFFATSGRGVAANLAAWHVDGDAPRLVAGQQLKMVAPTTHSQISWLGSTQPGPWRTETAMERALSPPKTGELVHTRHFKKIFIEIPKA